MEKQCPFAPKGRKGTGRGQFRPKQDKNSPCERGFDHRGEHERKYWPQAHTGARLWPGCKENCQE